MSNCNLLMHRCFNFKYRGVKMFLFKLASQLLNLVKKIILHSENINKMQTEFPRSGIPTTFTSYKNLATWLYFLLLSYSQSEFLSLCETFSLSESQAQNN